MAFSPSQIEHLFDTLSVACSQGMTEPGLLSGAPLMGCVGCSTTGQSSQFSTAHNINSVNPLTARRPPTDSRNATARWVVCARDSWVSRPAMQSCR